MKHKKYPYKVKDRPAKHRPYGVYESVLKRPMDFICALLAMVVLSPAYAAIAVLVRINLGSPVLFTQYRLGKNEKRFKLYKFRTMTDKHGQNGELLPDELRLTKFGSLLRQTSLDELPEIFNILKGDMSIVGPRPLLAEYRPYYTEKEHHRHDVLPGLTGLAQVNGRSFISWEETFRYDLAYIRQITFLGDIRIILKTLGKVAGHKDIADVSASSTDKDGQFHFDVGGKDYILHQPLNVEREYKNA